MAINVRFIHTGQDGRVRSLEVQEGTTVQQILDQQGVDGNGAIVRMNGEQAQDLDAPVEEGKISVSHGNFKGA